jgi:hypothetical protein
MMRRYARRVVSKFVTDMKFARSRETSGRTISSGQISSLTPLHALDLYGPAESLPLDAVVNHVVLQALIMARGGPAGELSTRSACGMGSIAD